jgi:hypothetical protein
MLSSLRISVLSEFSIFRDIEIPVHIRNYIFSTFQWGMDATCEVTQLQAHNNRQRWYVHLDGLRKDILDVEHGKVLFRTITVIIVAIRRFHFSDLKLKLFNIVYDISTTVSGDIALQYPGFFLLLLEIRKRCIKFPQLYCNMLWSFLSQVPLR